MTKPRIAFDISPALYGTGVSDYIINLVPLLDVQPFGYSFRRRSELQTLFSQAKTFPLPPTLMEFVWNDLHLLPIETLIGHFDVYHSSDWAQAPSKAKKVTTVHDLAPLLYPAEHDSSIVSAHSARMTRVVKDCDAVICVSESTSQDFQRLYHYPEEKIHVIYEAVPSRFLLKPNFLTSGSYLLAIGARQPRKNITRLINAYVNFREKYNLPPKLIIIGEIGQSRPGVGVEFTGYISDQRLVDLLAGAKALVSPSIYEGFGLPILEAFYHRVPVACSNTSSFPEVAGKAAVMFDPYDEENIAEAASQAIADKDKLVKLGKEQLEKFSWTEAAKLTQQVYASLC